MDRFVIDPEYLNRVDVKFEYTINNDHTTVNSMVDHPAFIAFKRYLIAFKLLAEPVNGDSYVLVPFSINEKVFNVGEIISTGAELQQLIDKKVNFPPVLYP